MNDETRHVDGPRSAIIVFRFVFRIFGEVSRKASYADSRTLCGLACAPRTSPSPWLRRAQWSRPTVVGNPAVSHAATGYGSFNLLQRRSFHFICRLKLFRHQDVRGVDVRRRCGLCIEHRYASLWKDYTTFVIRSQWGVNKKCKCGV